MLFSVWLLSLLMELKNIIKKALICNFLSCLNLLQCKIALKFLEHKLISKIQNFFILPGVSLACFLNQGRTILAILSKIFALHAHATTSRNSVLLQVSDSGNVGEYAWKHLLLGVNFISHYLVIVNHLISCISLLL